MNSYNICIIGAGASGLSAAISALMENPKLKILILEKKSTPGKKIIASGNGKCNLTNVNCQRHEEILDFFYKIGVVTRTDEAGRVYPYNEDSKTIEKALEETARALGAKILTDFCVNKVSYKDSFLVEGTVTGNEQKIQSEKLLIACGGKAGPQFGTTGDGYRFARKLGHTVTKTVPVLTAIQTSEKMEKLAGVRAKAKVILEFKGAEIFQETGEVQFTKTGVSGICIFNMSRFLMIPEGANFKDGFSDYKIIIDFFAGNGELYNRVKENNRIISSVVKAPLVDYICMISREKKEPLAESLRNFVLSPIGVNGWDFAQVTKGGVSLDEINMETMESRKVENLYFAGEIVDFDGPCGGYNLQNAWETGILAGRSMAKKRPGKGNN